MHEDTSNNQKSSSTVKPPKSPQQPANKPKSQEPFPQSERKYHKHKDLRMKKESNDPDRTNKQLILFIELYHRLTSHHISVKCLLKKAIQCKKRKLKNLPLIFSIVSDFDI